ncbi:hypothetical protein M2360_003162 [Rhizobium sp. SG_E_25_P2]|uniref:hypothetical protein n=1 Tax=Rhizobium sp. SG_E_25_P2 TaxID=2879942 RepID=UPI002476D6DF|nr:hypothetical protein [Rhizobium sp. SG_E_25_P2]MDH6267762.1 hypothetical protein [Rhizobium sp. SG_E_25_P2]
MQNRDKIEEFFGLIEGFENTLMPTVTYVSLIRNDVPFVVKARLRFETNPANYRARKFVSRHAVAETFRLSDISQTPRNFIDELLNGRITSPSGSVAFYSPPEQHFSVHLQPLHPDGLDQQSRIIVLQIRGEQNVPLDNPALDWELRAADPPYESLNELCLDFRVGALTDSKCLFEAVVSDVVKMDLDCEVNETKIELAIHLSKVLDRQKTAIGFIVYDKGQVIRREVAQGGQLDWAYTDTAIRGRIVVEVPPASVLHCFASYEGKVFHDRWFHDPSVAQNPRRAAYERFDPELQLLRSLCTPREPKFARDLESAIAGLLWMLGFSVFHLGGIKPLQNGPDLIATTPTEHYLVIECTTGQVKGESKLEKLVSRSETIREQLERSNNRFLKVIPVMVTSMTRAEVSAGIKSAHESGVYVVTQEDIISYIDRTRLLPQPDAIFSEAEGLFNATEKT